MEAVDLRLASSATEIAHDRLLERAATALGKLSTAQLHQVIAMSEKNVSPETLDSKDDEEARKDYLFDNGVNP